MFNYFKKSNKKIKNICSINITLDQNGIITTELFWPNFDKNNQGVIKKISENFGTLLYLLMSGSMNDDIFLTIDESKNNSSSSSYDKEFIKLLEDHIFFLKKMNLSSIANNNVPLISPTMVFKNSHAK